MKKYINGELYKGKIITKNHKSYKEEETFLLYSENEDCFYKQIEVFNNMIDIDFKKDLNEETLKEYKKNIEKNKYQYKENNQEEGIYVDESTITLAISEDKNIIKH